MTDTCTSIPHIRIATITDIPNLLPLLTQLGYPTTEATLEKTFKNFMTQEGAGVAVACQDHQILGWIAWTRSYLLVSNKTRFHIEGLVVDTQNRGQGLGKKLIAFLEALAKQSSPSIIDLTSGLRRASEGTHEFYQNLGYQNEGHFAKVYLRKEV